MEEGKQTPPKKTNPQAAPHAGKSGDEPKDIAAALRQNPGRKVDREMLLLEARRLRAVFREIAEKYMEETDGRLAAAISGIEAKKLPEKKVRKMVEALQELNVKARKGRRKDLGRIEKLAEALLEALEEQETA